MSKRGEKEKLDYPVALGNDTKGEIATAPESRLAMTQISSFRRRTESRSSCAFPEWCCFTFDVLQSSVGW